MFTPSLHLFAGYDSAKRDMLSRADMRDTAMLLRKYPDTLLKQMSLKQIETDLLAKTPLHEILLNKIKIYSDKVTNHMMY